MTSIDFKRFSTHLSQTQYTPSLKEWVHAANDLSNCADPLKSRIAFVTSYTPGYIDAYITVLSEMHAIKTQTFSTPYGQYIQHIVDPSSPLYSLKPDIIFLAIRPEDLIPEWRLLPFTLTPPERLISDFLHQMTEYIHLIHEYSNSLIVVHNFISSMKSPYGINDYEQQSGVQAIYNSLNTELIRISKETSFFKVLDYNGLVQQSGATRPSRLYYLADIEYSESLYPHLAREILAYTLAAKGLSKKCIVLDLDNTLWGGIIGEDGMDGIYLGGTFPGNSFVDFQRILFKLSKCGIILAICSKNNPQDAMQVIREHPNMILRENDFTCIKTNWAEKRENLLHISRELNIGLDSIVFIDDSPLEIEHIQSSLPDVTCILLPNDPALINDTFYQYLWLFSSLFITDEDKNRTQLYVSEKKRRASKNGYATTESFIRSLNIQVEVDKLSKSSKQIQRVSQLTLRTNQFNLTNIRYSEQQLVKYIQCGYFVLSINIKDKFGDYGLCGAMILDPRNEHWTIDCFVLSCRVLGRTIEKALLNYIIRFAKTRNAKTITGVYAQSHKNAVCEHLYPGHNFKKVKEDNAGVHYTLSIDNYPVVEIDGIHVVGKGWIE